MPLLIDGRLAIVGEDEITAVPHIFSLRNISQLLYLFFGVYFHRSLQNIVVCPYIIQSAQVVLMPVSHKDGIDTFDLVDKHLLPEIGAAIHYNLPLLPFHKDG